MNETTKIQQKEEWLKTAPKNMPLDYMNIVADYWLLKIDELLKEQRDIEQKRQILVINEFIAVKGENYPLGQYLNMLIKLDEIKENNKPL